MAGDGVARGGQARCFTIEFNGGRSVQAYFWADCCLGGSARGGLSKSDCIKKKNRQTYTVNKMAPCTSATYY